MEQERKSEKLERYKEGVRERDKKDNIVREEIKSECERQKIKGIDSEKERKRE